MALGKVKPVLRGIGQIFLQGNALSGLLILVGIFCDSWLLGIGAILGSLAGTVSANLLGYEKKDIESGLYGFNGALVGIAMLVFFRANFWIFISALGGAALSAILMNLLLGAKIKPFGTPFVLITWSLIFLAGILGLGERAGATLASPAGPDFFFVSVAKGLSQVTLQANAVTGIFFLLALLANSKDSAIYALAGSALGGLLTFIVPSELPLANIGLYGFNSALCAIAFSSGKDKSLLYALISGAISAAIMLAFVSAGLVALTAPFILSTWATLFLRESLEAKGKKGRV